MSTHFLRQGDRGNEVADLQHRLNQTLRGRAPLISEDGIFGPATRQAVVSAQRAFHLEQDGIVGPRTWAAMQVQVAVVNVQVAPPITPGPTPPRPPQQQQQQQQPNQPARQTVIIPPSTWTWFNVGITLQGQAQTPGIYSGVIQVMPTLRLRPLPGNYFQRHETHIEIGFPGVQYGFNTQQDLANDPRHSVTILGQGTLVDPFSWERWHSQFFVQAGVAISGIPTAGMFDWRLTHYVLQAQGGGQVSYDLIPNRWNLFLQAYGGDNYDATSGQNSGVFGGAFGTTITVP